MKIPFFEGGVEIHTPLVLIGLNLLDGVLENIWDSVSAKTKLLCLTFHDVGVWCQLQFSFDERKVNKSKV